MISLFSQGQTPFATWMASVVTLKPANGGQGKTSQRKWPRTQLFYPAASVATGRMSLCFEARQSSFTAQKRSSPPLYDLKPAKHAMISSGIPLQHPFATFEIVGCCGEGKVNESGFGTLTRRPRSGAVFL
jgi:hypothetical protein